MTKYIRKKRKNTNSTLHEKIKKLYNTCFYCGEQLEEDEKTIDHIIPLSKGGADKEYNLCVACEDCNNKKANMPLNEYVNLVLNGYDFNSQINKNKIKKGYGFKGAVYKEEIIDINLILPNYKFSEPDKEYFEKRLNVFLETGEFTKPTFVKKHKNKYVLNQGYINYLICKKLGLKKIKVTIVYKGEENNNV